MTKVTDNPSGEPGPGPRRAPTWRRQCRAAVLIGALVLPLVLATAWAVYARGSTWQDWLSRLQPLVTGHGDAPDELGRRAAGEPGVTYHEGGRVELGSFSIKVFNPVTHITLRTDFELAGTTACEDAGDFEAFVRSHLRFVREQVMVCVRNSELEDLTDPAFRLLKRRIVARVNLAMGECFLKSVEIKNFTLLESTDRAGYVPFEADRPDGS